MACAKSELCLFDRVFPQVVVNESHFSEVYPQTTVSDGKQIEFVISGNDTDYLDLSQTILYVKVGVTDSNDKALANGHDVKFKSYTFNTLFEDAILSLNNEVIEGGNKNYIFRSTMESLLSASNDTKDVIGSSFGCEEQAVDETINYQFAGSLRFAFFGQPRYLLPGVNVRIQLTRSASCFSLTSPTTKPKLKLQEAVMYARRVRVSPSVLLGHQIGLEKNNACYFLEQSNVVSYAISKGSKGFNKDNLFGNMRCPKLVIVALVNTEAHYGSYKKDASRYEHANLSECSLTLDNYFRESYNPDYSGKLCDIPTYINSVIRNLGFLEKNVNIGVSPEEFVDGTTFYTFNISPDFDYSHKQMPMDGNLRLKLEFNTPLAVAHNVLVYGIFDSEIQITKHRRIIKP